jgi:hypothetical protein
LAPTTKSARSLPTPTPTWITPTSNRPWSATRPATPPPTREKGVNDALLEFYKKLRPGDPPTLDNARSFVQNLFFSERRYDLGKVGRYKLNRRLGLDTRAERAHPDQRRLVAVIKRIIRSTTAKAAPTTSITWATAASRPWAS